MITLEQIRSLEDKVKKALEVIQTLQEENNTLRVTLEKSQKKIDGLEARVNAFKEDQDEIEQGIINVLAKLDELEDSIPEQETDTAVIDAEPDSETDAGTEEQEEESEQTVELSTDDEEIAETQENSDHEAEETEEAEEELDIF
jgi:FtsZ-binding cell division protein ZapB